MPYADALALGAMAFFSEKYGDVVRVVTMGQSVELCGGTHVASTGAVGLFRVNAQGGVAAGVRRIEAVTGAVAYESVDQLEARLAQLADALKAQPEHLVRKAEQLVTERARLEARLAEAMKQGGGGAAGAGGQELQVNGVTVTMGETDSENRDELGRMADGFRSNRHRGVLVLFGTTGRGAIHVALTDDLVQAGRKAGDLVNRLAAISGGKGGGRPAFASAGAGDPALLGKAREETPRVLQEWLAG
jgi:alanyl-tRNA synthetase